MPASFDETVVTSAAQGADGLSVNNVSVKVDGIVGVEPVGR
jgi:hypothetical protein